MFDEPSVRHDKPGASGHYSVDRDLSFERILSYPPLGLSPKNFF